MTKHLGLYRQLVGRVPHGDYADFKPSNHSREEFMEKISVARHHFLTVRPYSLFAPTVAFTNRVVRLGEDDDVWGRTEREDDYDAEERRVGSRDVWREILIRTKNPADGGIVTGEKKAIAIFNGDCPTVALVQDDQLAVLHCGFRTLIRENHDEPNIIEVAMKHFDPKRTRALVGHGIGSCCWVPEYDDKPEVLDPTKSRHPDLLAHCLSKTTEKSPFGAGHTSVDLYRLAKGLLAAVGISEERIRINSRCTCCAEKNGKPLFWSYTRFKAGKQEKDGRNMSVLFLDSHLLNRQWAALTQEKTTEA